MPQARLDHKLVAHLVTQAQGTGSSAPAATTQLIELLQKHHRRYRWRLSQIRGGEFNRDEFAQNFALEIYMALRKYNPERGASFPVYLNAYVDKAFSETLRQITGVDTRLKVALSWEGYPAARAEAIAKTSVRFNMTQLELAQALKFLTTLQAVSFIRCELEGAAANELALALGIVPSAVTHAIRRARRALMHRVNR